jgi:O-methyltransferase involved in polyketide biosynthesis
MRVSAINSCPLKDVQEDARCGTLCTAFDQEALKKARSDLKQQGEPHKFGIKEGMIEQFLVEREFCQI